MPTGDRVSTNRKPLLIFHIADGKVAVMLDPDAPGAAAVSLADKRWASGRAGLQKSLKRHALPHLQPKTHRFYRTANDALVFVCHVDADGDAKCHVLVADPAMTFSIADQGHSYWVYKSGAVSKDAFLDATTGGWLLEELPWQVPALSTGAPRSHSAFEHLTAPRDRSAPVDVELRHGLWHTFNGSLVAISRIDASVWGVTVAEGGHRFGDLPAPRRFVWNTTVKISGRRSARWACGQAAFEPVHMSTGL